MHVDGLLQIAREGIASGASPNMEAECRFRSVRDPSKFWFRFVLNFSRAPTLSFGMFFGCVAKVRFGAQVPKATRAWTCQYGLWLNVQDTSCKKKKIQNSSRPSLKSLGLPSLGIGWRKFSCVASCAHPLQLKRLSQFAYASRFTAVP